jgi:hypothetical protein
MLREGRVTELLCMRTCARPRVHFSGVMRSTYNLQNCGKRGNE